MIIVDCLLVLAAVAVLLPVSLFFMQVVLALLPRESREETPTRRPSLAVLVPAHNEALVIEETIHLIVPQLSLGDRILVVADNCSDDTAKIARSSGAEVIERYDSDRRGKGYALDFGIRHLLADAPEVLIVVDADCHVSDGAIERLSSVCLQESRPIQGLYLMHAPHGAGIKIRLAEFAWLVKDFVRPLGFANIGLPCQLMGTGMAFPWADICKVPLASGHIVEDLKLGIDLAKAGKPPLFCPDALVTSSFPDSSEGIQTQRARWEGGHLGMIVSVAPRQLVHALLSHNFALLALILDMSVPPLALLLLVVLTTWVFGSIAFAFGGSVLPLMLASIALMLLVASILTSWWRFGQQVIAFKDLAYAPIYALRKIPLYIKLMLGRKIEWVRTKRD